MRAFADEAVLFVRAGRGGDGAVSFRREPYTPRGGPEGGDGGPGGSVILEVDPGARDLSWFADHPHQRAGAGEPGGKSNRTGGAGRDLVLRVPDGTVVRADGALVADMVGEGARVVVARGGRGGRGNASLAGPRNRAPRKAEAGEPGEELRLELELRVVADVGLVGLPNAGKSTLLSKLSAARPKVAAYPFTTLTPNLGVSEGDDDQPRFVVADIPGLMEGAHEGKGLGHRFLRHVMRCRVLALVVDLWAEDPEADARTVLAELGAYDPSLAERPRVVAATKMDLVDEETRNRDVAALAAIGPTVAVSGVTGEGVDALREQLAAATADAAEAEPERVPVVVLRPGRDRFTVRREGERFRVVGRQVERWVAETDFEDPTQIVALQNRLRREGVERKLTAEGAARGDEVVIGDRAFEFFPEEPGGPGGSGPAERSGAEEAAAVPRPKRAAGSGPVRSEDQEGHG